MKPLLIFLLCINATYCQVIYTETGSNEVIAELMNQQQSFYSVYGSVETLDTYILSIPETETKTDYTFENNILTIPSSQTIKVYNIVGQLLYDTKEKHIDLQYLPMGIYFINLLREGRKMSFKLIKTNR